jgi:hypothetical protein
MAYWLSNTSTLLFLLQKSLKGSGGGASAHKKPPAPTSLFGRMTMVLDLKFILFLFLALKNSFCFILCNLTFLL